MLLAGQGIFSRIDIVEAISNVLMNLLISFC